MGSDIGKGGICGQVLLIIVNIVFMVLGAIALAIGAWAIATGSSLAFLTGNQIIGGSAILIIAGGVTIIIAALGILGALCKLRVLLVIYALVVLVIVIVEIVVGIVGFVYRDVVETRVNEQLETTIALYNVSNPNDANRVVDSFQNFFSCCGIVNASDWTRLNVPAIIESMDRPPNCLPCDPAEVNCATYSFNVNVSGTIDTRFFNATTVGCLSGGTALLQGTAIGAGVVGIIFGLLEIIGIVIALLLCCCIHRAHDQVVV